MKTFVVYVKSLYVLTERIAFTSSIIHWYSLRSYGAIVGKHTQYYLNPEWTCVCACMHVWMKSTNLCVCLNVISFESDSCAAVALIAIKRYLINSTHSYAIQHIHSHSIAFYVNVWIRNIVSLYYSPVFSNVLEKLTQIEWNKNRIYNGFGLYNVNVENYICVNCIIWNNNRHFFFVWRDFRINLTNTNN